MLKKTLLITAALLLAGTSHAKKVMQTSPDKRVKIVVDVGETLEWQVFRDDVPVVEPSVLGLAFKDQKPFGEMLLHSLAERESDSVWTNRLYKKEIIKDSYRELYLETNEKSAPNRKLNLRFRVFDGAVAFRYEIPDQLGTNRVVLSKELTTWRFAADPLAWVTTYPKHKTSQEEPFRHRSLQSVSSDCLIGSPAIVELPGVGVAALCEANLTRWAGLFFKTAKEQPGDGSTVVEAALSPRLDGNGLVVTAAPCQSPWRVMILGKSPLDLLDNNDVILNLNPPPEEGDAAFDWVKPGVTGWDWWVNSNNTLTMGMILAQICFAAEMGWPYHTIDGGWYGRGPQTKLDTQKLDPLPEFNFPAIFAIAKEKGVGLWLWVYWSVLEANDPDATFARFADWGVKGVKIDFMDRQDQEMVEWYEKIVRLAAKHKLMINFHGAFKPTGMNRTWPNQITREGILGNECNKFNSRVTAAHTATLPFTRFLLGPGDFTPGSFANVHGEAFKSQAARGHRYGDLSSESKAMRIYAEEIGTRAHSLALCVAYDSPLMTLCDWSSRYYSQLGLEALHALPTVWRNTQIIDGAIGESYVVARETYDGRFYLAAIGTTPFKIDLALSFLPPGTWKAECYVDGPNADVKATDLTVFKRKVNRDDIIPLRIAREGGALIIFKRVD